jgi:1,4-dihydroxy-6-naphthoate synthase
LARKLTLAISPCPNDTFAFCHLVAGGEFDLTLDDVEALNEHAARGTFDITKISVAAFDRIRGQYALLRAGGAAGFGVGPLLVAAAPRAPGGRIAIPGEHTTAALLLRRLGDFETVPMRFDRIEQAVLDGEVDCGVLIHEGRFTYARRGLKKLMDLSDTWEGPLPLGAIAIRRSLGQAEARRIDAAIRASVEHAWAHPEKSRDFVREHAQAMDPDVVRQHIELYVNEYTLALDEGAVRRMVGGDDPFAYPV